MEEWTGASLLEYPESGHELDVYAITPNGISIYVEIVWSDSAQNFFRDMAMIQTVDVDVKLVVANPKISGDDNRQREFKKIVIAQRKLGFAIHGDMINGGCILDDPSYVEEEFKGIVLSLMYYAQKYERRTHQRTTFEPPESPSVDRVEEQLLSNLFLVKTYPSTIFASPTNIRKVSEAYSIIGSRVRDYPFLPKDKKLYTFENLKDPSSIFRSIIVSDQVEEEPSSEWLKDEDKKNSLVYLLNLALRKYCQKRELHYDKQERFECQLKDGKNNVFSWRAGSRFVPRTVARQKFGKNKQLLYCTHYAAYLKFMFIENNLFLRIEPTITFTWDGYHPIRSRKLLTLMSRYLPKQWNSAYLNMVRFWAKYLSKLDVVIRIPAGEQTIEIATDPAITSMTVGIKREVVPGETIPIQKSNEGDFDR
jgi:hypothetical protein